MSILFHKEKSIHTIIKKRGKKCNSSGQDAHKDENIRKMVENLGEFADG